MVVLVFLFNLIGSCIPEYEAGIRRLLSSEQKANSKPIQEDRSFLKKTEKEKKYG